MSQTVVALLRLIELRCQLYPHKLLQCVKEEGMFKDFVQFSGDNVGSAEAKFEVHRSETGNGLVHIRSCYNNKYLVFDKNKDWIAAKAEKPEEDQYKRSCTLLRPISVDGDPKKIRLTHVHLETNLCLLPEYSEYLDTRVLMALASYSSMNHSDIDVLDVIDAGLL